MLNKLLKSKIHRATVTRVDLDYEGSIAIDRALMNEAGILPYESVHVWNVSNGERFETYAIPVKEGSGEICINGAAARLAREGNIVIVASFCWLDEPSSSQHHPKVVLVDGQNRVAGAR